ncbi:hypothetical protein AACK17_11085 [Pectobacterium punjabense]|uniref:hypothetical protein n=1 Tax=Pectobacterium punjabense TaxID=2108399 RepID=UPI0031203CE5
MQNTAKNLAYQRGLKAAGIWKGTKNRLKQWDATCVAWATRYHLPKLAGHVPVTAGIVLFASGVLLGGAIISVVLLLVAGLVSIILGKNSNTHIDSYAADSSSHYHPHRNTWDNHRHSWEEENKWDN